MRDMAVSYATKRGLSREAGEDLAHNWIIKVKVRGKKQPLSLAYVDQMRIEFGRLRRQKLEVEDYMLGSYQLPEEYIYGFESDRIRSLLSDTDYKLLCLMLLQESFADKCSLMGFSEYTIHKKQMKIKGVINEIFGTAYDIHRTSVPIRDS
jgi:hypothetical protein